MIRFNDAAVVVVTIPMAFESCCRYMIVSWSTYSTWPQLAATRASHQSWTTASLGIGNAHSSSGRLTSIVQPVAKFCVSRIVSASCGEGLHNPSDLMNEELIGRKSADTTVRSE